MDGAEGRHIRHRHHRLDPAPVKAHGRSLLISRTRRRRRGLRVHDRIRSGSGQWGLSSPALHEHCTLSTTSSRSARTVISLTGGAAASTGRVKYGRPPVWVGPSSGNGRFGETSTATAVRPALLMPCWQSAGRLMRSKGRAATLTSHEPHSPRRRLQHNEGAALQCGYSMSCSAQIVLPPEL